MNTSSKTNSSHNQRGNSMLQPVCEPNSLLLPPSIPITAAMSEEVEEQQQQLVKKKQKRIKRCHGNRKIQRFRKKCRAKGMKSATIVKRVNKRFNIVKNQTTQQVTTTTDHKVNNNSTTAANKRKRDLTTNRVVRSASEFSIVQSPPKKIAKTKNNTTRRPVATTTSTTSISMATNVYRCAPYLKRLSPILVQTLRLQLDHLLKKKFEQIFVYQRLQLLDKQYSLELHRSLWQSYLTTGSHHQLWPVSRVSFCL